MLPAASAGALPGVSGIVGRDDRDDATDGGYMDVEGMVVTSMRMAGHDVVPYGFRPMNGPNHIGEHDRHCRNTQPCSKGAVIVV